MKHLVRPAILFTALTFVSGAVANATPIFGIESVDNGGGPNSQAPTSLYRFDSTGGVFSGYTEIGSVRLNGSDIHVDGLAYRGGNGLFGFQLTSGTSGAQSRLLQINPNTGAATAVGTAQAGDYRGAAFLNNSTILTVDAASNRLLTIDAATGAILNSVALTRNASNYNVGNSVDVTVRGNTVYLVEGGRTGSGAIATGNSVNGTNFFSVNVATGVLSLLHQDLINEAGAGRIVGFGAAFEEASPFLYVTEMNTNDGLFRYTVPGTPYARFESFDSLVPSRNAGRGDLASASHVPEPGTIALLGAGLLAISLKMRKRKK